MPNRSPVRITAESIFFAGCGHVHRPVLPEARIAPAARLALHRLAEVGQQVLAAAGAETPELDHLVQLPLRDVAGRVVPDLLGEIVQLAPVALREEQHAVAGLPVASRASRFLVIALDRLGQRVVDHQPDVRLVDAHAEGDGRRHDRHVAVDESLLRAAAGLRVEAGVVGQRGVAAGGQSFGEAFGLAPREAVDDGRLPSPLVEQIHQLPEGPLLRLHRIRQVGAVEAGDEAGAIAETQLGCDVFPYPLGRRRGQRHHRRIGEARPQLGQVAVVGAEVVAPLADAVRLVDGDEADGQGLQEPPESGRAHPLGRGVENPQTAGERRLLHAPKLVEAERAVDEGGGDAVRAQRVHLVLHQRDKRRHHQGQAARRHRGQLIAQRLAPARRDDDEAVPPRERIGDDRLLPGAELVVAEMLLEQAAQIARVGGSRGRVGHCGPIDGGGGAEGHVVVALHGSAFGADDAGRAATGAMAPCRTGGPLRAREETVNGGGRASPASSCAARRPMCGR